MSYIVHSSLESRLYIGSYVIDTSVPIAYTFFYCRGYETHVSQCILSYYPPFSPSLSHQDDIGISCQPICKLTSMTCFLY